MTAQDIRYERLGYVALNVSDLARSEKFYEEIVGLTPVKSEQSDRAYFRCSAHHHDIVLHQSATPGLKRIGWAMQAGTSLNAARQHLASLNLPTVAVSAEECRDLSIVKAFRSKEPNSGAVFEFFLGMKPDEPFVPTHTKIARLGHAVLNIADRAAAETFLT